MISSAKFKKISLEKLQSEGFLTATDIADYLVLQGLPFRDAHEITGKTVAYCVQSKKNLAEMSLVEFKKISPKFKEDVLDHISIESSMQRKASYGGTARKNVVQQMARLQKILKKA
jgi:argininosuccinate lyase